MVICAAAVPPETRQHNKEVKESPELIDDLGGPGQGEGDKATGDNDREEGEIMDEYELIISSEDEEFKLRARIQQLEENNKDVERMDMLSANLAHHYSYPKPLERFQRRPPKSPVHVLSDVSSLSENELDAQRKVIKQKLRRMDLAKRYGSGMHTENRKSAASRRYKHTLPPRRRPTYPPQNFHLPRQYHSNSPSSPPHHQDSILVESLDSVTDDELHEYDEDDENEDVLDLERLKLSRDKLRVALAQEERREMYKNSLRDRLQCRLRKSPSPKFTNEFQPLPQNELPLPQMPQHISDTEENTTEQATAGKDEDPAELKLRLIALKSAMLKKHFARKKRDAERAYSPTDMINRVHPSISNVDDIDDLMEISPAASPEREQTPPRYSLADVEDTKPVDMDLAETDSDDQHRDYGGWNMWGNNWNSLETAGGSWRCFMPNSLPPVSMPIVIDEDDEEDIRTHDQGGRLENVIFDDDEEPPPPPPFHIPQMHLEDEDAQDAMHLVDHHSNHSYITDMQSVSMENSQTRMRSHSESSDDEAGALRAMLLSNLRPIKPPPPPPPPQECPPSPPPEDLGPLHPCIDLLREESNASHDSDDPEELRSLLLSSLATKKTAKPCRNANHGLPEILKNAVKRFQASVFPSVEVLEPARDQYPIRRELNEPEKVQIGTVPEPQTAPIPAPLAEPVEIPQPVENRTKSQTFPSSKIIKIVKPNKVINKKTTTKRKIPVDEGSATSLSIKRPSTLMIKEPNAPLHSRSSSTSSTRLITTVDPATIRVKKLVISLGEESAASDDELELNSSSAYISYADIASPLSLAMGSASGSTTRSNTPTTEIADTNPAPNSNLRRTVINDYFEKKIDDFLKQARSKAPVTSSPENSSPVEKVPEKPKVAEKRPVTQPPKILPIKISPGAVRHLPVASQKEYLRLIERMQMLEKKKQLATKTTPSGVTSKASTMVKKLPAKNPSQTGASSKVGPKPVRSAVKDSIKSVAATETAKDKPPAAKIPKPNPKINLPPKESRLKAFENSFKKIGGSMITNLEKSLQLVEEAKKSKVIRLQCSQRLKELYAEMQSVKQAVKQEELKLSRIQPEIQASHEIIMSLKQKRHKLYTAAMDLGRGLRGDDYRLIDEGKPTITQKSTLLTKEIRLYNSIAKYDDLKKLTAVEDSQPKSVIEQEGTTPTPTPQAQEPPGERPMELEEPEASDANRSSIEPETMPLDNQAQCQPSEAEAVAQTGPFTVTTMRELREHTAKGVGWPRDQYFLAYQTPMSRNYNSDLDVHATICPFDLMGRCEDADCSYLHLARPDGHSAIGEHELPKSNLTINN
ncbi:uncharacterized protein Dana_GF13015 [Drosophila ananassae]|uniref:Putative zinc-finger domain-containing protein n=1 Tax=Drosophila ananassae TaxID=7217 RepID=B3MED6_DROAN|nr:uncharacterized protein LOC6495858 [Drosophila ananassae]EDV36542.2 uncharacterized protein Dana_GF13015 [Drosophila ananassae]